MKLTVAFGTRSLPAMFRLRSGLSLILTQQTIVYTLATCNLSGTQRKPKPISVTMASVSLKLSRFWRMIFALTREDPDSVGEQCLVTLGLSSFGNLVVVVYAYREPNVIRLISAWKANKRQRLSYEKNRR